MRTALLPVVCCLLFAISLHAQNNVTTRQVGEITYFEGTLHGEAVTGSARQIGDTIFYDLTVGGRPVSYAKRVSSTPSSTQVGQETYVSTSDSITYTSERVGDVIYTRGSNGCVNTTTIVEGRGYITGDCPR
jgi:uncharacterized membrane protein